eukprot:NODE_6_length_70510_cov_1.054395.p34 type:complete len:282 gc:universal NODE_6_length_70510_cov_1.054395:13153-13998(+)
MRLEGPALSKLENVKSVLKLIQWSEFEKKYGDEIVAVSYCNMKNFNMHKCVEMSVSDFLKSKDKSLYLKDWHFESKYNIELPCDIRDDWMNEFFILNDFKFLYLGKKESWSPIHCDVYRSHSWSANILGSKIWYFYDPSRIDFEDILNSFDSRKFEADYHFVTAPGDVVWVPSGWAHQVHNMDELTMSYNRNWCDHDNVLNIANYLRNEFQNVRRELKDIEMSKPDRIEQEKLVFNSLCGISVDLFLEWMKDMSKKHPEHTNIINQALNLFMTECKSTITK